MHYSISNFTLGTSFEWEYSDPHGQASLLDFVSVIPSEAETAGCTHSGGRYVYDEKEHYRVCELCGQSYGDGGHVFGADGKCACRYYEHEHVVEWKTDNNFHYSVCTVCGITVAKGRHQYVSANNCECEICGQTVHHFEQSYDKTNHYNLCRRCHFKCDIVPHTFELGKFIIRKSKNYYDDGCHIFYCDNCEYGFEQDHYSNSGKLQPGMTRSDRGYHYSVCDLCGELFNRGWHPTIWDYCIDYSDFDYSVIIGMPEEEAIATLGEWFGEELVIRHEELDADGYTVYSVDLPRQKCEVCNAVFNRYDLGDYVSVSQFFIEHGKVSRIEYAPEQSWCSSIYHNLCPQYEKNLPEYLSWAELRKYAEEKKATFNGIEYGVEAFDTDCSENVGLEGAKIYSFEFKTDKYIARYDITNYVSNSDFTGYEIKEPTDESSTYIYMICSVKSSIPGDVNGDSSVTLDDAIMTLKFAMNVDLGDAVFDPEAADVAGEAGISLEDAVMILKVAMGVEVLG